MHPPVLARRGPHGHRVERKERQRRQRPQPAPDAPDHVADQRRAEQCVVGERRVLAPEPHEQREREEEGDVGRQLRGVLPQRRLEQHVTEQRNDEIVESAPRDGLGHHHDEGDVGGDEQAFEAARPVGQEHGHVDAEERGQEERGHALVALPGAELAQLQVAVLLADQRGERVGERQDQQRNAEQELVAAREPEQQRAGWRCSRIRRRSRRSTACSTWPTPLRSAADAPAAATNRAVLTRRAAARTGTIESNSHGSVRPRMPPPTWNILRTSSGSEAAHRSCASRSPANITDVGAQQQRDVERVEWPSSARPATSSTRNAPIEERGRLPVETLAQRRRDARSRGRRAAEGRFAQDQVMFQ